MKTPTRAAGIEGERLALKRLRKLGYKIIETNFNTRRGEIDIIARHGDVIVFIEVKARSSERFGTPLDAVDARKRRRIVVAAREWLSRQRICDEKLRFDVAGVRLDLDPPEVEIVEAAFSGDDL